MNHIDFSRNLIKGRIAETIFEEMFRQSEEFTVIPIGYEHTIPELAQYQHHVHVKKVLDNIRNAPDFALISQNKEQVFLVEVKFRKSLLADEVETIATNLSKMWLPSYIFIATPDHFFFDPITTVIKTGGYINKLNDRWISNYLQDDYINLLNDFIQ